MFNVYITSDFYLKTVILLYYGIGILLSLIKYRYVKIEKSI